MTLPSYPSRHDEGTSLHRKAPRSARRRRLVRLGVSAVMITGLSSVVLSPSADAAPLSPVPGAAVAWGLDNLGQATVPAAAQSGVVAVSGGTQISMALKSDGSVVVWGDTLLGALDAPSAVSSGVTAISAGYIDALALKSGAVISWGLDPDHKLNTPPPAATQSGIVGIAAGDYHNLALTNTGSVIAWGSNMNGATTVPESATFGVTAVAAGGGHSLALKSDGSVVAWGDNTYGETNVPVAAQSGVTAVAAKGKHSMALKNGGVIAWGNYVALDSTVPAAAQSGVVAIAAGFLFDMALKSDGTVVTWGSGYNINNVPIAARSGVRAIAAGQGQLLAVAASAPQLTQVAPPATATAGTAYSYRFTASGTPVPTFSIPSGTLPTGLMLSPDGTLSGAATTAGTFHFKVRASNGVGANATSTSLTIVVSAGAPATLSVSDGDGQQAATGTAFATRLAAIVTDSFGNPAPGVSVTFSLPSATATSGSATFPGSALTATAVTNANGIARSPRVNAKAVGPVMASASVAGLTGTTYSLTVTP